MTNQKGAVPPKKVQITEKRWKYLLRCEKNNEKLKKDVAGLIEANVRMHGEIKVEKDANLQFRKKNEHLADVLELERRSTKNAQQAQAELLAIIDNTSDSFWKRLQYLFTGKMYEKVI